MQTGCVPVPTPAFQTYTLLFRVGVWSRGFNCGATSAAVLGGKKIALIYIIYITFSSLQSRLHGLTADKVEPGSSEQDFYMNYLLLSLLLQSPWQARRDIFLFFKQVNVSGQSKQPEFHLVKVRGGGFEVVPLIEFFFFFFLLHFLTSSSSSLLPTKRGWRLMGSLTERRGRGREGHYS